MIYKIKIENKEKKISMIMEQSIKSFIYLDDYKLYSLSSQMFQGFTEYIISGSTASMSEEESQKGTFASGKMMSDILKKEKTSTAIKPIWI